MAAIFHAAAEGAVESSDRRRSADKSPDLTATAPSVCCELVCVFMSLDCSAVSVGQRPPFCAKTTMALGKGAEFLSSRLNFDPLST